MLKLACTYYLFLLAFLSAGQIHVAGRVLDSKTNEPIPYANIGIFKSEVGTLSNPDGSFSIDLAAGFANDTVSFSALGFEIKKVPIQALLNKNKVVYLSVKVILLKEVLVHETKVRNKTFELGNEDFNGGIITTDTTHAGRSNSLLIENKGLLHHEDLEFPLYITKARLRILKNNLKSFKVRLRLNAVDSISGSPGNDLLQKSIVVESSMKNGWLEFDLSQLNIIVSRPFFITFEQILTKSDRTAITDAYREFVNKNPNRVKHDTTVWNGKKEVRHTLSKNALDLPGVFVALATSQYAKEHFNCYVRETSFGEWKRVQGILTATVTLSNQRAVSKKD
jgi:hypothetical protein